MVVVTDFWCWFGLQVEGSICQTNTSSAPELAEFYRYWERRFFNAITMMIITSMATLHALLNTQSRGSADGSGDGAPVSRRTPLCQVKVTYNSPEALITPALPTIYKFLGKAVKHLVESAKLFVRCVRARCCVSVRMGR